MDKLLAEFGMTDDESEFMENNMRECRRCESLFVKSEGLGAYCPKCCDELLEDDPDE